MVYTGMALIFLLVLLGPIHVFGELEMVALVFRHGDRTAVRTYPNDPHKDFDYDGLGFEALTPRGVRQMYNHGSRLKQHYESLFASEGTFRNSNFQAKTSELERTLMTGLSFLAGFYPPSSDVNPISINWQPIPITTIPLVKDYFLKQDNCERANAIEKDLLKNPPEDLQRMIDEDREMIDIFEANIGLPITLGIQEIYFLFDTLQIQSNWNLTLPEWVKPEYMEKHDKYVGRFLKFLTETDELRKLRGGPLVTDILDNMYKVNNNDNPKQVLIYSGHDSTLSSLFRALSVEAQATQVFDYGATLAFELHAAKKTYTIQIKFYPSADSTDPIDIVLPNCNPCYLDQFASQYQHIIVRDLDTLCQV